MSLNSRDTSAGKTNEEHKYKQTEVGLIPVDWDVCDLQDAVDFLDGMRRPVKSGDRAKISGVFPYYGASGIVDYVNDYIFDDELILLGEDGENILSRNLPLAFKVSGKIWVNNHAHVLKPKSSFDITFLTEFLESLDYSLLNSGTAQPKLNKKSCLKIKIAKPALEEQTAIANALSDVDALIQELEKLIAKKQAIKTATMQQLLTGRTRFPQFAYHPDGRKKGYKPSELGEIPEDWEVVCLGDLATIKTGSRNNQDKEANGAYPFFVRSETVERLNTFSYDCEAILVPGEGGIGSIFHYIHGKFDAHQRVYVIRNFQNCSGKFVYLQMRQNFGAHAMENSVKATVDSLRLPTFQNFTLLLPSVEEQDEVARILWDMDEEVKALGLRLAKTRQIKQGMMQELLTGKTRLVKPESRA